VKDCNWESMQGKKMQISQTRFDKQQVDYSCGACGGNILVNHSDQDIFILEISFILM